jgi:hypothetical protein
MRATRHRSIKVFERDRLHLDKNLAVFYGGIREVLIPGRPAKLVKYRSFHGVISSLRGKWFPWKPFLHRPLRRLAPLLIY